MALVLSGALLFSGCNYPGEDTNSSPIYPTDTLIPTQDIAATSQLPVSEVTQAMPGIDQDVIETPTGEPTQTPTFTPVEACIDKAELVEDVTVEDGTSFSPGETFIKTWRLRNSGTCIWNEQYNYVFTGGNQLNGASPIALSEVVPPGETIDISVSFTAPEGKGDYRGEWQLQNGSGVNFGFGEKAQKPFDVEISVIVTISGIELGAPTWDDTFKNTNNWYLLETYNTVFSHKKGHLIMKVLSSGKKDEWGLATHPELDDFYMEATFKIGDHCEGRDRYGLVIRVSPPNSAYVISFACDGSFRFYRWDGSNYYALQEWKEDSHIITGPGQTNRMGILAVGDSFELYANGELLGEYEDDMFDFGRFGLMVGSAETSKLVVYVEDIAYWVIDD
ncbi:MAG: DUF1080 domain-containing protein [Anaerolineales bacterium]|nr:DUF1080 domain-containing protein [Anaerolineales bacterium]